MIDFYQCKPNRRSDFFTVLVQFFRFEQQILLPGSILSSTHIFEKILDSVRNTTLQIGFGTLTEKICKIYFSWRETLYKVLL